MVEDDPKWGGMGGAPRGEVVGDKERGGEGGGETGGRVTVIVWVLAQTVKEADELASEGYGYLSESEARAALADPEIDHYYRRLLRVFKRKGGERLPPSHIRP